MPPTTEIGVNRCIYCGATRYDVKRAGLAEEHVIPLSLHGHLIIPNASCCECERKINRFETLCARKMFGPIRYYLGLKTRNPKSRPENLPVTLTFKDGRKKVKDIPISQHPTVAYMRLFEPARFMGPLPKRGTLIVTVIPYGRDEYNKKNKAIADSWGAVACATVSSFSDMYFAQLIAKIAHCYTVSVVGLDKFRPILTELILNASEKVATECVGCDYRRPGNPLGLHELTLEPIRLANAILITVRVRLFSYLQMPEYVVATGALNPCEPMPKAHYIEPGPVLPPDSINADVWVGRPTPGLYPN